MIRGRATSPGFVVENAIPLSHIEAPVGLALDPAFATNRRINLLYAVDPDSNGVDGDPGSVRSKVWAMGLRNPYRSCVRPGTGAADPAAAGPGTLFIGDRPQSHMARRHAHAVAAAAARGARGRAGICAVTLARGGGLHRRVGVFVAPQSSAGG